MLPRASCRGDSQQTTAAVGGPHLILGCVLGCGVCPVNSTLVSTPPHPPQVAADIVPSLCHTQYGAG